MFHTVIEAGADGTVVEAAGRDQQVADQRRRAGQAPQPLQRARPRRRRGWRPGGTTPCRRSPSRRRTASRSRSRPTRGTRSSRTPGSRSPPRRSRSGPSRSAWPRCATPTRCAEFADIARQEYVAVGIRAALHPTLDLATEPRWARQAGTFGQDPDLVTELGVAYLKGFQQDVLGPGSVACTEQALPRRRPAEGRRGRPLPLRPRAGLPRRAVRRPPQAVPADHRGRHRRDHALLRHAGRARDRRREDRGGRLRLQPPGRHRPAARAARLRRRRRHRLGARQRQPRRRPGAAGARLGRRAPRPARADGAASSHAGADQFGGEECVDILLDLVAAGPGQRGARRRVGPAAAAR